MSNVEGDGWDFLSGREAEAVDGIREDLGDQPWAQQLLRQIPATADLTRADKALLFELRFAGALHRAGIVPRYEVTGEGNSTLDFAFESGDREWRVELMRLEETEAALRAIVQRIEDGIRWIGRILTTNAGDRRQSEEGETLKAVQRICQKCELKGRAYKFPLPDEAYQALLVDFRTFLHGGDEFDRVHVGLGGHHLPEEFHRRYWEGQLITGVFDARTKVAGAEFIRERVHFIGFVNEEAYDAGDFGSAVQFIANPHLFASAKEVHAAMATWPLQPYRLLNGAD